jgi:hypothetical protein
MAKFKFRVGDKVRRISIFNGHIDGEDNYKGMKIGDIGIIRRIDTDCRHLFLHGYDGGHWVECFELVDDKMKELKKKLMGDL